MEYSSKLTKSGSTDPSSSSSLPTLMAPPVPLLLCMETIIIIAEHLAVSGPNFSGFCHASLMSSKQISRNSKSIGEGLSSASTKTVHFRVIVVLPDLSSQECSRHFRRRGGGVSKITVERCW